MAGAGDHHHRDWVAAPADVDVPIHYPGHAHRLAEPRPHELTALADEMAAKLMADVDRSSTFVGLADRRMSEIVLSYLRADYEMLQRTRPVRRWRPASWR